jgi:hypothetical protein
VTELFASYDLQTELEDTFRAVAIHVAHIRADEILSTPDQVIIEGLVTAPNWTSTGSTSCLWWNSPKMSNSTATAVSSRS